MTTTDFSHENTAELVAGAYSDILAKARAQIAASEEGSPIWVKATALAEDVSRRMGESLNKETAATGPDTLARGAAALDSIRRTWRDKRNAHEAAMSESEEGQRYSAEYRAELMKAWEDGQQAEAEAVARNAWQAYSRAEDAARQDMKLAYQENESRFDLSSIGVMVRDIGSQIQAPPTAQGTATDRAHRLGFIAEVLNRAEASGDPNMQRAARIAAAPEVQRMMTTGGGDADQLSRDLHRRLGSMADAERGRVVEVEKAGKQLQQRGQALRASVLDLETSMTGAAYSMFGGPSPWAVAILGDSGVVH